MGNPPKITTWINGVRFMEFEDNEKRHPDAGGIALQVHGGGDDFTKTLRPLPQRPREDVGLDSLSGSITDARFHCAAQPA